jgi:hypothetical protein
MKESLVLLMNNKTFCFNNSKNNQKIFLFLPNLDVFTKKSITYFSEAVNCIHQRIIIAQESKEKIYHK